MLVTVSSSVLHSNKSRSNEAWLSLVQRFKMLLRQLSNAIKNQLGHPKIQRGHFLLLTGSLWHKDKGLRCLELSFLWHRRAGIATPVLDMEWRSLVSCHCMTSRFLLSELKPIFLTGRLRKSSDLQERLSACSHRRCQLGRRLR